MTNNTTKGSSIKEMDIHQMSQIQAKTYITGQLKSAGKGIAVLRVIHGYHGGTMLRDMIRREFRSHPRINRIELSMNPGITDIILK